MATTKDVREKESKDYSVAPNLIEVGNLSRYKDTACGVIYTSHYLHFRFSKEKGIKTLKHAIFIAWKIANSGTTYSQPCY